MSRQKKRVARSDAQATPSDCACTIAAYTPPRATSCVCVPCSTTRPHTSTAIESASRTVERRCATRSVVRPLESASSARPTAASEAASSALVGSSSSNTLGSLSSTRAIESRCFCPTERAPPSGPRVVS
mmetsp:Transcript_55122/g.126767  ORF Transcript_55122/g.126767 Transcript_55122/m.126767 type:complete len:129 (+) Transcript_55122:235-621(+)